MDAPRSAPGRISLSPPVSVKAENAYPRVQAGTRTAGQAERRYV